VLVGTSAGAVNAAAPASLAHLPAQDAADRLVELRRQACRREVFASVSFALTRLLLGSAAGFPNLPWSLRGILDTTPLRATLTLLP
jgi:NTE family protein